MVLPGAAPALARSPWPHYLAAWAMVTSSVLLLFSRDVLHLFHLWWNTSTFGHCLLIPPILAWLVWQRRDGLADIGPSPWLPGVGLMLLGTAAWMLGELAGVALVRHAALVFILQASVLTVFGLTVGRAVTFPLAYALFVIPIGEQLVPYLQVFTAHFSVWLLELFDVPAYLDGVFISIPNGDFEVAEACSGVRFLIAMIAFSVLVANVCYLRWTRRILFVTGAIISSVISNGLRAWGIIYLASRSTPDVARGIDHIIYGWFFFAIVMGMVLAAGWPFFDRPVDDPFIDARKLQPVRPAPRPRLALVTAGVLGVLGTASGPAYAAWTLSRGTEVHTGALSPLTPPGWRSATFQGTGWRPNYAGASATILRSYVDASGRTVDLYIAVYDHQSDKHEVVGFGQGLIPPAAGGGGWAWAGGGVAPGGGRSIQINRGATVRDAWQWYEVNGKVVGSPYAAKVEGLKAKLFGGDPRAATVVISAERTDPLTSAAPDLARFAGALGPIGSAIDHSIVRMR